MLANKILSTSGSSIGKTYVDDVFSVQLRTGNGGLKDVTTGFQPDLIWNKARSTTTGHRLVDSERGVSLYLESGSNVQQQSSVDGVTAFNPDGYSLGTGIFNGNGTLYVDWVWKKAPKFFTHTLISHTNGTATNVDLSELGEVGMVFAKITNTTGDWRVWHRDLPGPPANHNLSLNSSGAALQGYYAPLSVSGTTAILNGDAPTGTYIIYGFAHDTAEDGFIQCGSYTGNGNSNGPVVTLGWEPQYVMIKNAHSTGSWRIFDSMRGMPLGNDRYLAAERSDQAEVTQSSIDPTATGFKVTTTSSDLNTNGGTYVYMAIRMPNKPPTLGTEVFRPVVYTGTNTDNRLVTTGIKTDMVLVRERNDTTPMGFVVGDRLRGNAYLLTGNYSRENADADTFMAPIGSLYGNAFSVMDGFGVGNDATSKVNIDTVANNHIAYAFKRAPRFFDIVTYNGTNSNTTQSHNLAEVPDLLIVKSTNINAVTANWAVWCNGLSANEKLVLNSTAGKVTDATAWNGVLPTSTNISLGTSVETNTGAGEFMFIAYAFSNLQGIQKIGTYLGNGTSQTIDCGFSTGARFVCIKAISTPGDWLVADSSRGIVAGTDPRLRLNANGAEITTEDWLDPHNSGFIVNEVANSNANTNEVTYMYWAIS